MLSFTINVILCYNIYYMSKDELLKRMAKSMARSMEVEGADYDSSYHAITKKIRSLKH